MNGDEGGRHLESMYSLRRYDWTLHVAALVLCAYFLARAVTTYVAGVLESPTVSLPVPAPVTDRTEDDGKKEDESP